MKLGGDELRSVCVSTRGRRVQGLHVSGKDWAMEKR